MESNTASITAQADEAWSQHQVAKYLGLTVRRVRDLVGTDGFPAPRVLGPRTLRWSANAVRAWLAEGDTVVKAARPARAVVHRV
jgi:excisionase family DNA binding protein